MFIKSVCVYLRCIFNWAYKSPSPVFFTRMLSQCSCRSGLPGGWFLESGPGEHEAYPQLHFNHSWSVRHRRGQEQGGCGSVQHGCEDWVCFEPVPETSRAAQGHQQLALQRRRHQDRCLGHSEKTQHMLIITHASLNTKLSTYNRKSEKRFKKRTYVSLFVDEASSKQPEPFFCVLN